MPEQNTITGVVQPGNAPRIGMKVQAFDRDMPSLERRGSTPEFLGEAITDAQGGFKITYTLDQFQSGEGQSLFRPPGEKSADISFHIFDRIGQELSIKTIEANRPVGPDLIVFNAPAQLTVNISVGPPLGAAISEYERLLTLITPIIEDVPLAELADEDVRFILNELEGGQGEIQQRIEWLRRCAVLAQETNLPTEAFYGWGRKNVPAPILELAAVPLKDLPNVLEKLTGFLEDALRQSLLAAVTENIIPISFRERVDAIVRQLIRHNQVAREVVAQLQDVETKAVLAGYAVTAFSQENAVEENHGLDLTDNEGKFSFVIFVPKEIPANAPPREFRLEVVFPSGEKLPEGGHVAVDLNKPATEIFPALIKVPKPEISRQQEELKSVLVDVSPELRAFLNEQQNIQTLSDIRRKGGLSHLPDLPGDADPVLIRKLESLADLDRVSPDISVSNTLLAHNFDSVQAISNTPHSEFVAQVSNEGVGLKEVDAAKLHVTASSQTRLLDNMLMGLAANNANGFKMMEANGAVLAAAEVFQPSCGCDDCAAAVSPAAYLAALLDYALKHIRKNGKDKIDLQFLVDTFHQPFTDLPTDCKAVEEQVRRVRICIEALRGFVGSRPLADSSKESTLAKGEADYSFAVYSILLSSIGTSYEEIRRIRSETAENRKALAERLRIDLTEPRPADKPDDDEQNGDELDQLFLDPSAQLPKDHLLTAQVIEKLFGLSDTVRDSLSEGAKLGDDKAQIARWNLNGVTWNQNTDPEGKVYVKLVNPTATVFRVELYKDSARTKLVAAGEIATASGTVRLNPENNSRLSGMFEIAFTADSTAISIAAIPTLLSWQLKHLRTLWSSQDHPVDVYSDLASVVDAPSPRLPIIDPDIIGPDDFRHPTPKLNLADPDRAFDLWLNRRAAIDQILAELKTTRETPGGKGVDEILERVLGNPLPDLDGLLQVLTRGGSDVEVGAAKDSVTALGLSVESFTRLMAIRAKDQLALNDPAKEKVSAAEWSEVYSILAQAQKAKLFEAWRTDEKNAGTVLGLEEFWFPVREPQEGDWPPILVPEQPLINPAIVKLTDLPDWLVGKEAIALWNTRKSVEPTAAKLQEWIQEENKAGLVYWQALKAKLPRWRASVESRQVWQQALRVRSQPPIIDPTVIGPDDLQRVVPGDPAFDLWKDRYDAMTALHDELKAAREAAPDLLTALDHIVKVALGFELAELDSLDLERLAGHSIEKRLDQLNLDTGGFTYLMRIRGLAKASQPIVDLEWDIVYDTLARAKTRRKSVVLRKEEQDKGINLAPDFFKIPKTLTSPLPFTEPFTPRWLSTRQARSDWQDTLQSRTDQEDVVGGGLRSAISAVEEATLPLLRDALIQTSDAPGTNLEEQAEWITSRLLIDARAEGCQITTRVAQALETLQTLIFDLRSGQFKQLPTVALSLVSDDFDEEWKWIGSYATWRSAMFVFLYPENVLQPSLLKNKSPVFETLIKTTRPLRINPATACQEAESYAAYFSDICSLEIEATCQAPTVIYTGEGCDRQPSNRRSMFYMFGRAASGKIYWSAYEAGGSASGDGQTLWSVIPGFGDTRVVRIVGAMPYGKTVVGNNTSATVFLNGVVVSAYIHLFCITANGDKQALKLARLSLDDFGIWDGDGTATELSLAPLSVPSLQIVPVQTQSDSIPPGLVIRKGTDKQLYYRQLNYDGVDWEQNSSDWTLDFFKVPAFLETKIEAAVRVASDTLWLVISDPKRSSFTLMSTWLRSEDKTLYVNGKTFHSTKFLGALPVRENLIVALAPHINRIFIFYQDASGLHYIHASSEVENGPVADALADLIRIVPHSGSGRAGQQILAYQRSKNAGAFYMYRYTESGDSLVGSATIRAVPRVEAPLGIPLHLSAATLQQRRQEIVNAFALNADAPSSVLGYLHEAYYFVPLHLALALQSAGHHLAALDCFRTVYDYEAQIGPPNQRNIYYGLELDAKVADSSLFQQADGWLLDPLNPHSIAATRHLSYTRFTIMSLVRCLLDFADSQFTQETGESLATARTLYLTALDLLDLPELQQKLGVCDDLIAELKIEPGKNIPPEVPAAVGEILEDLTGVASSPVKFHEVTKEVAQVFKGEAQWAEKLITARAVVQTAAANAPRPLSTGAILTATTTMLREQHARLITDSTIDDRLQRLSKSVMARVFEGVGIISPAAQPESGKSLQGLPLPPSSPVTTPSLQFCIPPNPILKALRLHAELNLFKLRTCRNIAGLKRQLDLYAAPTDTTTGVPSIGVGGQLVLPGIANLQPSLYRYPVLIERAKQLVQLAAQIEAAMLSALEKRDAEAQLLLQARQQLSLAQAGVRLHDLRVGEANDGVTLADLQKQRAQIQIETYEDWIQTGANEYENQMIFSYQLAALSQKAAADASFQIQAKQAVMASAALTQQIASAGGVYAAIGGLAVGGLNLAVDMSLFDNLRDATRDVINFTLDAQIASVNAALERRKDEWQLQKRLAEQDSKIGEQQRKLADDHVQIATQERVIAGIQADNAKDSVEFLTNKFTNVELFDWMGNILERVYSFFLQQATAMAKLAVTQLAFDRQEVPPAMIESNYWEVSLENGTLGNTDGKGPDRRGLTGSARLLQDIFQLDQYAFDTNKRKLSLTKTLSLARLAPVEFERFRETGVMPFATPMELFDRGFPGHYLRLIKRVHTSVIALVPSVQGIYATLSTTGPSRVVIGGDVFQTIPIRRAPEFLAISSPNTSTGVNDWQSQSDLLLPFEGSGVEMSWEFNMPKAANAIDYRTIADVLITLEYTALYSSDYRQQVIQSLKPTVSADRPFSFRNQFADEWYDLHNPGQTSTPMTVRFKTLREDFPSNIEAPKIQHVILYFVRSDAASFEVSVSHLHYAAQEEPGTVGGSATSIDGIISTRRGNAGSWTAMIGKSAIGDWELALPNTEEMRSRLGDENSNETILDILLVITYSGRTPDWPS